MHFLGNNVPQMSHRLGGIMATFETRRTKKGKTTIRAKVRVKGYTFQTATFDKLTDAKTWAYGLEADMRKGKHIKYTESSKHTLSELIDKYIKEELPNRNSDQDKFMMHLAWWKSKIGNRYLKDVTPQLISEYKLVLANEPNARATKNLVKKSPATVNRYLATLSIVLSKAYKEWEWIEMLSELESTCGSESLKAVETLISTFIKQNKKD